jgi:hypothetical protein
MRDPKSQIFSRQAVRAFALLARPSKPQSDAIASEISAGPDHRLASDFVQLGKAKGAPTLAGLAADLVLEPSEIGRAGRGMLPWSQLWAVSTR